MKPKRGVINILSLLLFLLTSASNVICAEITQTPDKTIHEQNDFRLLLSRKMFSLLNEKLGAIQKRYAADFRAENDLTTALYNFEVANPKIEPVLDEWVSKYPQDFQPFLCRGAYFYTRGSRARGTDYVSETLSGQLEGMEYFFRKASTDLRRALELNPSLIHAYSYMVRIAARISSKEEKKQILEKAINANPYTIIVRQYYLRLSTPRWGGSLGEMKSLIDDSRRYFQKYPEMKIIEAEIDLEEAFQAYTQKDVNRSIELYNSAISKGDSVYAYTMRGETYKISKQLDKAIMDFDRAIDLNPFYIQAYTSRWWCKANLGDIPGAIADLDKLIELEPTTKSYYQRAFLYEKRGELAAAIADYGKVIEMYPKHDQAYFDRGRLYQQRKEMDLALADYGKAIEINPNYSEAYNNRGNIFSGLGKFDLALSEFNNAIKANPKNSEAYLSRGIAHALMNNCALAISDYSEAIRLGQKSPNVFLNRGVCYHSRLELEKALEDYDKNIELDPKNYKSYVLRGKIHSRKGRREAAVEDFSKAIDINPNSAEPYCLRGFELAFKGEFVRAISDLDKALEINPRYAEAYKSRGVAYGLKGDLNRAISDFNKSLEIDPSNAYTYNNRGFAFKSQGEIDRAIEDFGKAIEINPKLTMAYINRGNAYAQKKENKNACSDWKAACGLGDCTNYSKAKEARFCE